MIDILNIIRNISRILEMQGEQLYKQSEKIELIKSELDMVGNNDLKRTQEVWLIGSEVQRDYKIGKGTLKNLRDEGMLACSLIKGRFYYKRSDLDKLFESNYTLKCKRHGNRKR